MASIFLGASGAIMDLSVDITSAVTEVVDKKPDISKWEAVKSGMNVGKAAMGTMTTTLLFAYSGGYIALLMVFMAQGTPVSHILNYKYVAAELIHTVIGSFIFAGYLPITRPHLLHFAPLYYHFAPRIISITALSAKINLFLTKNKKLG